VIGARNIFQGILIFAFGILLLALLTACSWHGKGKVVARDYDRAWTSTTEHCSTRTQGTIKTRKCEKEPVYHPASWSLLIRDEKDGSQHWVPVSEFTYNRHPVGTDFTN
jgi:hypothetical protein